MKDLKAEFIFYYGVGIGFVKNTGEYDEYILILPFCIIVWH